MMIYSMFIPQRIAPALAADTGTNQMPHSKMGGKGQLREAKPKQSGAASLKRASTKRRNIQKRS